MPLALASLQVPVWRDGKAGRWRGSWLICCFSCLSDRGRWSQELGNSRPSPACVRGGRGPSWRHWTVAAAASGPADHDARGLAGDTGARGHTDHIQQCASASQASTSDGTALEWGELGPSLRCQLVKFFSFFSFSLFLPDNRHGSKTPNFTPHPPCCVGCIWYLQGSDTFFFSRLQKASIPCVCPLLARPTRWSGRQKEGTSSWRDERWRESQKRISGDTRRRSDKVLESRRSFCAKSQGKRLDGGSWAVRLALDQWVHWSTLGACEAGDDVRENADDDLGGRLFRVWSVAFF